MRRGALLTLSLLAVAGASTQIPATPPQTTTTTPGSAPVSGFAVQQIAEGVYAVIRKEPPGLMFNGNSVFIINDADVVVVDTMNSPNSGRDLLAALKTLTPKPVSTVINTHWHDDHIMGNVVFRDAFPGVEFIGHPSTLVDLPATGATNRQQMVTLGPTMIQQLRMSIDQGKSLNGAMITPDERVSYASDAAMAEKYLAEVPSFEIVLPTRTVQDRLTITRGTRTIEIRHLGRGHTGGDLVVYLPAERIAITGDLLTHPIPLVGSTSHPADFGPALEELAALRANIFVPGHGPVMRDDAYLQRCIRLLTAIRTRVSAAVARGETLEETRRSVTLDDFRKEFAGDSQLLGVIFDNYVSGSGISAAFRAATRTR